jgi:hypothetical protein
MLDLSIIIVNWNSATLLRGCLSSIYDHAPEAPFEVVVIDNASYDGCAELIANEFPQVRFLQSSENLGFAKANNVAVNESTGRNLLFLNPDTEIVGTALHQMLDLLDRLPDAGMVGPILVDPDLSVQTDCARKIPTILNQTLVSNQVRKCFRKSTKWRPDAGGSIGSLPESAEVIPGACIMAKRTVFGAAGGFNEGFFMYAEDIDLSYEVVRLGWKNFMIPSAAVIHYGGCSSKQQSDTGFSSILLRQCVWKFFILRRGKTYAGAYRLAIALIAVCRLLIFSTAFVLSACQSSRVLMSIRRWYRILRWTFGLEKWAVNFGNPLPIVGDRRHSLSYPPDSVA